MISAPNKTYLSFGIVINIVAWLRLKEPSYCAGLLPHTMGDEIARAPAQYVPRVERLTSALDVYKILYKVKR